MLGVTIHDLKPFDWAVIGLWCTLMGLALFKPRRIWVRVLLVGMLLVPVGLLIEADRKRTERLEARAAAVKASTALYDERCKASGVRITRTVTGERGLMVMKMRRPVNTVSQYALNDQYGRDYDGDAYLRSFLKGARTQGEDTPELKNFPAGFDYVDYVNPKDGLRYRYTAKREMTHKVDPEEPQTKRILAANPGIDLNTYRFVLRGAPTTEPAPRYGVTFDDISTREDRDHWIAGSSLRVVDLTTGEVIAERIGYMRDPAIGSTLGGRQQWLWARGTACPAFTEPQTGQTLRLVRKVLLPDVEARP